MGGAGGVPVGHPLAHVSAQISDINEVAVNPLGGVHATPMLSAKALAVSGHAIWVPIIDNVCAQDPSVWSTAASWANAAGASLHAMIFLEDVVLASSRCVWRCAPRSARNNAQGRKCVARPRCRGTSRALRRNSYHGIDTTRSTYRYGVSIPPTDRVAGAVDNYCLRCTCTCTRYTCTCICPCVHIVRTSTTPGHTSGYQDGLLMAAPLLTMWRSSQNLHARTFR